MMALREWKCQFYKTNDNTNDIMAADSTISISPHLLLIKTSGIECQGVDSFRNEPHCPAGQWHFDIVHLNDIERFKSLAPPPIFNLLQLQLSAKEDIVTVNEGNTKTIIQKDSENAKTRKRR